MTEPDQPASPYARRGFIAAGLVVALIVIAAVVVAVTGGNDGSKATPRAGGASTAAPSTSYTTSSSTTGCNQPAGSQLPPVTAPTNKWELVGSVAAPTAPTTSGPGKTAAGGLRTCFAHDPTGALFAAVNFLASTTDNTLLPLALGQLTSPGAGHDAALTALSTNPSSVEDDGQYRYQVSGFTFLAYTGDVASVSLAIATAGGNGAVPITLDWSGTDWLVDLPADGNLAALTQALPSLAGYVPWSGA